MVGAGLLRAEDPQACRLMTKVRCAIYTRKSIIDDLLWQRVRATLAANVNGKPTVARAVVQSILAGRLFDDRGIPIVATHACKGQGSIPLLRQPGSSARRRCQRECRVAHSGARNRAADQHEDR